MPIFEYRCLDCEEVFETLVLSGEEPITCRSCLSGNLEKQFSPFGVKSERQPSPSGSTGGGCGCSPSGGGCGVRN